MERIEIYLDKVPYSGFKFFVNWYLPSVHSCVTDPAGDDDGTSALTGVEHKLLWACTVPTAIILHLQSLCRFLRGKLVSGAKPSFKQGGLCLTCFHLCVCVLVDHSPPLLFSNLSPSIFFQYFDSKKVSSTKCPKVRKTNQAMMSPTDDADVHAASLICNDAPEQVWWGHRLSGRQLRFVVCWVRGTRRSPPLQLFYFFFMF